MALVNSYFLLVFELYAICYMPYAICYQLKDGFLFFFHSFLFIDGQEDCHSDNKKDKNRKDAGLDVSLEIIL